MSGPSEEPSGDPSPGDSDLEALCARWWPKVVAHARLRSGPTVRRWFEPEDVAQQVFVELRERFDGDASSLAEPELLAWLCKRVDWRLASVARDHGRVQGGTALPEPDRWAPPTARTDGPVTRADDRRKIGELIEHLPAEYAQVVRLCGLEGLSFVEASRRLQVSPDTVRKRYKQVRETLARQIRQRDD